MTKEFPSFAGHAAGLAPYQFETDHAQYMSLVRPEDYIPPSLELRAKAALKELADVRAEFEFYSRHWESDVAAREEKFDDAMSHYQVTKDEWERLEDEEGNVHWVNTSYIDKQEKPLPFWPFGDTSEFY